MFEHHNLYIYVSLTYSMEVITIHGTPIIDIYESFDGSYWFVTEKAWTQDSVIDGKLYENDQILYGYVRLSSCPGCAEFGHFSKAELKSLGPRVWKVPQRNWSLCPEVKVESVQDERGNCTGDTRSHGKDMCSQPLLSCSHTCKEVVEKMNSDTQQRLSGYLALFDTISEKTDSDAVAIAILHELSKDRRSAEIHKERETRSDEPATEKQKQFMKKLNIPVPANLTKREASMLLDEELGKNGE